MRFCVSYGRPASGEAVGSMASNDCDLDEWIILLSVSNTVSFKDLTVRKKNDALGLT